MMRGAMAERAPGVEPDIGLATLAPASDPIGSRALRMLRFERRWLVRVFEELLPKDADARLPIGAADVPMGRFVDDLLAYAPLEFVTGLRLCLWMVMLAPVIFFRRARTFLSLGPADKTAVLDRLRGSDRYVLREAPILLKTIACLGFCGLPPVQQALGIDPIDTSPPSWAAKRLSNSTAVARRRRRP
jgi:hypothetical protein